MQIRVAVGMLAALVLVLLAPSMTEGLVLTRCEMQQKLQNQTLPANISSNLSGNTSTNASSDAAHIVCYAELVSGLNTSKVSQPMKSPDNSGEDGDSSESSEEVKPHKGRRQRSLGSKSEKKSDKGDKGDKGGKGGKPPKPDTQSVTKQPFPHSEPHTESHPHNTTGGNHTGSHDLHPKDDHSSESSEEVKPNKGRKQRSLRSKSEKKSDKGDKGGKPPKPDSQSVTKQPFSHSDPPKGTGAPNQNSSMTPNPVRPTGHHDDDNSAEFKSKGRHRRSPKWPRPGPKPQPKPDPKPQPKPQPKPEPKPQPKPDPKPQPKPQPKPEPKPQPKPEKSGEQLYGVFQLSDRVACASGTKPTLNLCGLTCDKLVDDDITDDIACLKTLLSKFTPVDSLKGEAREHVKKLYDQIYQKQCAGATDAQFFSGC
ncbi:uncharacterized protein LOC111193513 isoform X1 [Astyanax mexicanus]|uniref:uncharacterized protein LOC111193513 isoform X1 n=1 Tax=Astyanax mexicanus TaxID=7994 RepID=UPI0020CAA753|nr:uncharacterized protein LOC111193513 isoform X1 [Astyanax mexicanus]